MSGGHFGNCGYDYYKVAQFADELEHEIQYNGKTYFLNPTLYSKYLEYVGVDRMDLLLQVLDGQTEYTQELGDMIDQAYSQGQELGKERFLEEFSENLDEN
jgi:hypothetical protein